MNQITVSQEKAIIGQWDCFPLCFALSLLVTRVECMRILKLKNSNQELCQIQCDEEYLTS
jgi:hypothetical protein